MGGRCHEFLLTLKRKNPNASWGFSLVGGADVNTPLIVTKVAFGSPSDGVLQRGDIISKVGNYDARDIRHEDAQNLFRNAGDNIRIVVQRDHQARPNTSTGSSRSSSRNYGSPLSVSPHLSPRGGGAYHAGSALMPTYGAPFEEMREGYFDEIPDIRGQRRRNDNIDVHVVNQVADSVLQRISTDDPSKQVVHKQFNSPIGLYSDPNIADTLQRQTGANVSRRNVKYDPSKSETYKALQEQSYSDRVHEVPVPPQTRIYTPIPGKKHHNATHHQPYQNNTNSLASPDDDDIQQSHSFKRLMWSVLPETDY
ncbi:PDZ and LIM domain protein 3-like isoform X4 [Photinus pyralis]|uniref:PDZ domain-containing protein n=1 Tax=Photinus pyralis TaxID=7054 RepID=A0A1Y1KWX7_PHOPY|nr:PDZ and LIM domain protein 3-like isoform X4 [Photinus pyralis]